MRHLPLPIPRFGSALDRFFDDVFQSVPSIDPTATPRLDIWEESDAYGISVELPGFTLEDIELTVHDGQLRLHARHAETVESGDGAEDADTANAELASSDKPARTWLRRERSVRDYARTIEVPKNVDTTRAEASFDNGVLEVRLPKSEASKPHRIGIKR